MTSFVLQWRDYLKDFKVDSFDDFRDALGFHAKLEFKEDVQSTKLILDEMDLKSPHMSSRMRRDIYNIIAEEGHEAGPDEVINHERLYMRLCIWIKEE